MDHIMLFVAMVASAVLSVMSSLFGKYNKAAKNTSRLYSVIVTLSAALTWGVVCLVNEGLHMEVLAYSLGYGVCYTMAMVGMFKAYQLGSVSLTAFIKQLSLIAVTLWGFVFWGNPLTANITVGLVLIVVALYFCFKPDKYSVQQTPIKWVPYALMLLVGNAGCAIIQKYQQLAFDGKYGNALMFFGTLAAFVFSLTLYLVNLKYRPKNVVKLSLLFPVVGGVSSAFLNLLILRLLSSALSESVIFPGIAVGGLTFTTLFSLVAYHERLRVFQWIGLSVGVVALIFLNIT